MMRPRTMHGRLPPGCTYKALDRSQGVYYYDFRDDCYCDETESKRLSELTDAATSHAHLKALEDQWREERADGKLLCEECKGAGLDRPWRDE